MLAPIKFLKIYDLKNNKQYIKDVQKVTLDTDDFGVKIKNGLFGSREWWSAVKNGNMRKYILEGVITKTFMSGHNDFPEFEVFDGKHKTILPRFGNDKYYIKGKRIKIIYIKQDLKKLIKGLDKTKEILEIYIQK